MARELWKGNEAIAEAAIKAGCRHYFGYPITPQSEIPEYMAAHMPKVGGMFLQSESEVSAINMLYGAAGSGARVMTTSSSPGIALMQEGISYMAGAELPALIVNVMRGGPGLGTIQPSQADYYQATRGGGNGDYRLPVYAPSNIQEAVDLVALSFDVADRYRTPVMMLADGMIGQMMEAIEWHDAPERNTDLSWASSGMKNHEGRNIINSLFIDPVECSNNNHALQEKYNKIAQNEVLFESRNTENCDVLFVSYGTPSRIVGAAISQLEEKGVKAGLLRPITLWPFPYDELHKLASQDSVKGVVAVELSLGQMLDDVKIGVNGIKPVSFVGSAGGVVMKTSEVIDAAMAFMGGK